MKLNLLIFAMFVTLLLCDIYGIALYKPSPSNEAVAGTEVCLPQDSIITVTADVYDLPPTKNTLKKSLK